MVKPSHGTDPLLRRPFSVFEVLRDATRRADRASRSSTSASASARRCSTTWSPGATVACLGPLGRPFEPVDPPARSVDGRRRRRPRAVRHARRGACTQLRHADDAVLRRAHAPPSSTTSSSSNGSASTSCSPPKTAAAARRAGHRAARRRAAGESAERRGDPALRVRPDADDARGRAARRASTSAPCDVSLEQVMGCGLGGCYSCVVLTRDAGGAAALRPLVPRRPGLRRAPHRLGGADALTWICRSRSARCA